MRTVGCLSILTLLALEDSALAQGAVPPPSGYAWPAPAATQAAAPAVPPPTATPQTAAPTQPATAPAPAAVAPAAVAPAPPPAQPQPWNASAAAPVPGGAPAPAVAGPGGAATGTATASVNGSATTASSGARFAPESTTTNRRGGRRAPVDEEGFMREQRESSLTLGNTLAGGVGLLHMPTAFSGAAGTFRVSFLSGYFSGSKFLCPSEGDCTVPADTQSTTDEAESMSSDIAVSATVLPYLEGYLAMHSVASSNTLGDPQLLQVVGDTNFGVKLFSPIKPDRLFHFGANLDLWLLNGSGMVGVDNANFTMRALAGVDLTQRADPARRIPLRFHTMLGYLVDGSGALVEGVEESRGGNRISRIERFGLDINRVDSVLLGVGAEYVHRIVQPFVEWTFDVPNNRQGYECALENNGRSPGDSCLALESGFSSSPSRLTIGTRISPGLRGLSGLLALDIGTGATSNFIEEVAPEVPWKFYFGLSFAHDVLATSEPVAPKIVEKVVQLPPPPEYRIVGLVLDDRTQQPIANAIIRYEGQPFTGLVSRADGSFESASLQPAAYSFAITAEGYRDGQCQVTILTDAPPTVAQPAPGPGAAPAAPADGIRVTNAACPLKALPPVGTIQGNLLDAQSNGPVPNGRLTIRDAKGRELSLDADGSGAFRFENVPAGAARISAEASGYLPQNIELDVRARAEQRPTITLNRRPKRASVVVTANEVKLTKQVNFANDSANISPESQGLVQEIALTLQEHPELLRVEIQGHTDNSGAPAYNKRLSQERAEAVRNALVTLGIDAGRLTAMGYGQEKPLMPNASEAGKAKNRRVQMMVLERKK